MRRLLWLFGILGCAVAAYGQSDGRMAVEPAAETSRRPTVIPPRADLAPADVGAAAGEKPVPESQEAVEQMQNVMASSLQHVEVINTCSAKGTASLGVPINGHLGIGSCYSYDPTYGTFYADFYTFTVSSGRLLKVEATSLLTYMATIQDYSSGTVLASTGSCGISYYSCSFTYSVTVSGTYTLGIGSFTSVGGDYTLKVSDITPVQTSCLASTTALCLSSNRFRVSVSFIANGSPGTGQAVSLTSDTGYFWFFSNSNIELVVKVLDARAINGRVWVFYGALSNVDYTITVTDTQAGTQRTYHNPQGTMASVADTSAF
jgi:hypothetical protein